MPNSATSPRFAALSDGDPRSVGPFKLLGRIAAGGMGTVFAGRSADGGTVAVKAAREELASQPEPRARFAREADLASRVRSPCVPVLRDSDTAAAVPWLATDYVPGPTLQQYVRTRGPLRGEHLLALAAGLAHALSAVHAHEAVHRDLKPGNVLLAPHGPVMVDFGIAREVGDSDLTRTGDVVGTSGWMSPEQYGGRELTERSDVFSWGALVAYAATGREPFGTGPANVLAYRVLHTAPDLAGLPDEITPVVTAALSPEPSQRPTAEQALRAVYGLWDASADPRDLTAAVSAMLATIWTGMEAGVPEPARRRRWPLAAGASAGVLVLLAATATVADVTGAAPWPSVVTAGGNGGGPDDRNNGGNGGDGGNGETSPGSDGGLPEEAVASAENGAHSAEVEIDEYDGAHFTLSYSDQFSTTYAVFTWVQEGPEEGATLSGQLGYSGMPNTVTMNQDAFYVTDGTQQWEPAEEFEYDAEAKESETMEEFGFHVPGAPKQGLLVYRDPDPVQEEKPIPSVAACYDLEGSTFSTDYEECV
ncbi:serine/threonine protein kinase [Haloactinospora alba]|uniref:Serine/threonine protein kinase n=1 Tax=Haloactinospora alba TaxID=405555 RepID=A0A543NGD0_9ACTN|nr:serine/threonine-protein kinase [Haloactinospora alba]TQN30908.1 serine/threonine protein kinase [Haloactinospora alba]